MLQTPAHEIDVAVGEAHLAGMNMPLPLPDVNGEMEYRFDQDDFRLLAHLMLHPDRAERFLLNRAASEHSLWDTHMASLCLYRLGYNPDRHVEPLLPGSKMGKAFAEFLKQKDLDYPDPGLSPFLLKELVDVLCEHDGLVRSPLAVVDRKITLNPDILPGLLQVTMDDQSYQKMSADDKTFHQQRLKNAFDAVAVPQRLTDAFDVTQQQLAQPQVQTQTQTQSPPPRVIMIPPFRVLSENYDPPEAMVQFQRWLFHVQALLDNGVDVSLHDTTGLAARRDTFTRDKFIMVNGKAYMPDPLAYPGAQARALDYYGDIISVRMALIDEGVPMVRTDVWFEGGDAYVDEKHRIIIAGTRGADDELAGRALRDKIIENEGSDPPWQLVFLPQINTHGDETPFYHRDLMMSPELPMGHRLICPEATTPEAIAELKAAYKGEYEKIFIEIPMREAVNLSLNSYGAAAVILSSDCPTARRELEARGYNVVTPTDYGLEHAVMRAGGIHCVTNELPPELPRGGAGNPSA